MSKIIEYFRNREWSMGNGQCDDCEGHKPGTWLTSLLNLVSLPERFLSSLLADLVPY